MPEPGAEIVRDRVDITLAAPPKTGLVPPVTRAHAWPRRRDALTAAHFGDNPQPSSAGDDWVVIRQDHRPGSTPRARAQVTLAVENRTPAADADADGHADRRAPTADADADATPPRRQADRQAQPKASARQDVRGREGEAEGEPDREGGGAPAAPGGLRLRRRDQRPALSVGERGTRRPQA